MNRIESSIISNLINNEEFARKVIPHLKSDYFMDRVEAIVASTIMSFFESFNKPATKEIISIEIGNIKGISDKELQDLNQYVENLEFVDTHTDWLIQETEKFCKERSVYNAIVKSIAIIEGKDQNFTQDALPSILSDALAVSFDNSVGHDYMEDANSRYDFYHEQEERLPFDLEIFNKITGGGLPKKTLNIALAGTGVGKSLFMCHVAAGALLQSRNVLYITMEMAEKRIAERIDANLMNLTMDELKTVDRETFNSKLAKLQKKSRGKLIVKEYPTAGAHAGHFRALLEELKVKKNFAPDIIMIDYLNICASQRMKQGGSINSYTYVKSIAEELRGLAIEYNVPILSATQTTRGGYNNSDVGLEDTSESFGLPATADLMFALISNEELQELNQIIVKQLKNRYNDPNYYKRFVVGIDRSRMKLYDVEASAQEDIHDSGQHTIGIKVPTYSDSGKGKFDDFKF